MDVAGIALPENARPPILQPCPALGRTAPHRRVRRKAPVCVHDRTSFRLAPTEPANVLARGYKQERSHSSQTFSAERAAPAKDGPRINEEITARTILLIGDDGHKYGEIGTG